jgi:hypothetical protein
MDIIDMNRANLEILGYLTDEPLERKFPDQELGRLLVAPNRQLAILFSDRYRHRTNLISRRATVPGRNL